MITKLVRIGDDIALVLDPPILKELGLDEGSEVDLSIDDGALVVTPVRDREQRFRQATEEIDRKYADVFRRLSDS